ncbi:MAG: glycosyltransferase family 39 protein [Gemmatimonadota bacterium]|nr:glycosyltransferase family 39 protein [Gemmatimonadota bacterium]
MKYLEEKNELKILIICYLAAVSIGLLFIFVLPHPLRSHRFLDYDGYDRMGLLLARGEGFSGSLFRTPGYPLFLACVYKLFGHSHLAVQLIQVFLNGLVPLAVYYPAKRFLGFGKAISAVIAVTFLSFPTFMFGTTLISEGLAAVVLAGGILFFFLYLDRQLRQHLVVSAFLIGYLVLIRPGYGLFTLFLSPFVLFSGSARGKSIIDTLVFNLVCLCVLLPWGIYNYVEHGNFTLLSSEKGLILFEGACESGSYRRGMYYRNPDWINMQCYFPGRINRLFVDRADTVVELKAEAPSATGPGALIYRFSPEERFHRKPAVRVGPTSFSVTLPVPPEKGGCLEYYFEVECDPRDEGRITARWPSQAPGMPAFLFHTDKYIENPDPADGIIDIFDLARAAAAAAGRLSLDEKDVPGIDVNLNGRADTIDVRAIKVMLRLGSSLLSSGKILDLASRDRTSIAACRNAVHIIFPGSDSPVDTLSIMLPYHEKISRLEARGEAAESLVRNYRFFRFDGGLDNNGINRLASPQDSLEPPASTSTPSMSVTLLSPPGQYDRTRETALKAYTLDVIRKTGWPAYALTMVKRFFTMYIPVGANVEDWKSRRQFYGARLLYPAATLIFSIISIMSFLSVFLLRRRWKEYLPYLAIILYIPLTHLPFKVEARYASSALPYLILFAVMGLSALLDSYGKNVLASRADGR